MDVAGVVAGVAAALSLVNLLVLKSCLSQVRRHTYQTNNETTLPTGTNHMREHNALPPCPLHSLGVARNQAEQVQA